MTTTRSPLKDEPGWATHTPFPNFGKAEYFCGSGLTEARHRRGPVARMERKRNPGRCRMPGGAAPDCTCAHPGTGLRGFPPYIICLAQ
ncbi:hypothetical protein C7G41_08825 [Bradyrhizobium sp. MOS002]|nr:hypothetical protein C7G41_08825 [Bradyrhizobium sp. MOS002]